MNNNTNKPQDKKSQCNCCSSQDNKNQGGQMKKNCGCMHHKNDQNRK